MVRGRCSPMFVDRGSMFGSTVGATASFEICVAGRPPRACLAACRHAGVDGTNLPRSPSESGRPLRLDRVPRGGGFRRRIAMKPPQSHECPPASRPPTRRFRLVRSRAAPSAASRRGCWSSSACWCTCRGCRRSRSSIATKPASRRRAVRWSTATFRGTGSCRWCRTTRASTSPRRSTGSRRASCVSSRWAAARTRSGCTASRACWARWSPASRRSGSARGCSACGAACSRRCCWRSRRSWSSTPIKLGPIRSCWRRPRWRWGCCGSPGGSGTPRGCRGRSRSGLPGSSAWACSSRGR